MRAKLVLAVVAVVVTVIVVAGRPGLVEVTCGGATSDAAALQGAIDSSGPGATIDIRGGICLLTRGISLPGDRTYAGTADTVLKQDASMSYVLAAAAYTDNSPGHMIAWAQSLRHDKQDCLS